MAPAVRVRGVEARPVGGRSRPGLRRTGSPVASSRQPLPDDHRVSALGARPATRASCTPPAPAAMSSTRAPARTSARSSISSVASGEPSVQHRPPSVPGSSGCLPLLPSRALVCLRDKCRGAHRGLLRGGLTDRARSLLGRAAAANGGSDPPLTGGVECRTCVAIDTRDPGFTEATHRMDPGAHPLCPACASSGGSDMTPAPRADRRRNGLRGRSSGGSKGCLV